MKKPSIPREYVTRSEYNKLYKDNRYVKPNQPRLYCKMATKEQREKNKALFGCKPVPEEEKNRLLEEYYARKKKESEETVEG